MLLELLRFFKKEFFEGGAGVGGGEKLAAVRVGGDEFFDLGDELGGGVLQHHFGLVFESEQARRAALA